MTNLIKSATDTNILIVDDTPDNLRLLTKMLESQNYTVRKALNGRMALQAAYRDPPDLILLDINMPEMNGYEVCRELHASEITCDVPIIFISALDHVQDKVKAFESGGKDYITKPFQELEVLARIQNQLLIQQQQQQLAYQNCLLEEEIEERRKAEAEVQRLNFDLERRVNLQTLELQQALRFESTLKRISDKVRDSLDQHQILQNAVEELAVALKVSCCDAVLYSSDHSSSLIRYQYISPGLTPTQGQLLYMVDAPEIYTQLQDQHLCFAFCQIQPLAIRNHSAILACPIFDDQVAELGILGDLWVFKEKASTFGEMEIHLVQQVANQCAIALRQARLYEAAQAQVRELEHLNHLKDDFLSTISHELRTPIASMKMVIQLLTGLTKNPAQFTTQIQSNSEMETSVSQYLGVLQEECDRELSLVEDLLSLQHIEAGNYTNHPAAINLQDLIPHLIEPFETRAHNQQQSLVVKIDPAIPVLQVDLQCIHRIVTELLSNACKYTPAGETIAISVNLVDGSTLDQNIQRVELQVSNTGVEISSAEIPHIFDKFYRIPNNDPWKYGGTGLGLALVKKLVDQLNGTIKVDSADNRTTFIIQLDLPKELH